MATCAMAMFPCGVMATTSFLRLVKLLNEFLGLLKHIVGYLDKARDRTGGVVELGS